MDIFNLPHTTKVNKIIPKNAFDEYISSKQKKQFTDLVNRITWLQKISANTVNLEAHEIKEIQIFLIELKVDEDVQQVIDVIDKSIPYNIIFIVEFQRKIFLSTSTKHPHPRNENNAVIDWTFKTDWFTPSENKYNLNLKKNLDTVYLDFCMQLSGERFNTNKSLPDLVQYKREVDELQKTITRLKANIANSKQFNQKVELNLKLKEVEKKLKTLIIN